MVQYQEQMHSDLPATLLRGYVQLSTSVVLGEQVPLANVLLDNTTVPIVGFTGVTPPHYLGPTIVATKDRPVRVLFRNLLPTGIAGDLFIPVDTTVMGAGPGPLMDMSMGEADPLNPMCGMGYDMDGNRISKDPDCYSENRATLHLHGGITPLDQRRHAAPVDHPRRVKTPPIPRVSASHQSRIWRDSGPRRWHDDLLLHQPAERPPDVLPRPCLGHHPPQCVCRRGRRLSDHR